VKQTSTVSSFRSSPLVDFLGILRPRLTVL
jgi:hypothetical protein